MPSGRYSGSMQQWGFNPPGYDFNLGRTISFLRFVSP